jgi:hypothetical protein
MQRILILFLVVSVALVGCQSTGEIVPTPQKVNKPAKAQLLTNMPVSAENFTGTLSVTHFDYVDGQLLVDGVLSGTVNGETVTQEVNDVPATLSDTAAEAANFELAPAATCDVLFLDLGPLDLDLLGVVVNLSPIELNIDAVSGPGNLLGNLLCAVTGLLDGGPLASIFRLIDNINRILDGIG